MNECAINVPHPKEGKFAMPLRDDNHSQVHNHWDGPFAFSHQTRCEISDAFGDSLPAFVQYRKHIGGITVAKYCSRALKVAWQISVSPDDLEFLVHGTRSNWRRSSGLQVANGPSVQPISGTYGQVPTKILSFFGDTERLHKA